MDAAGTASGSDLVADTGLRADSLGIDVPVQDEAFAEAFARQATQLVIRGGNRAEIHLTPRDLGPVRIAIALDVDAASLEIAADRHETRSAIEASMPTLRQMLAEQGVRLADWRVAGEAADRRQATAGDAGSGFGGQGANGGSDGGTPHGSARGLPQPVAVSTGRSPTGPGSGDRDGPIASAAHDLPRPDMSRGGNRLDLFA